MSEKSSNAKASWHYILGLGLLAALVLVSCFSRQLSGNSWDFLNHFRSAGLMLEGLSPYSNTHFQSLPLVALPFTVFHGFSFENARWIYAGLHALCALSIPYLLFKLLQSEGKLRDAARLEKFCTGVFVAFIASFRFLDNEFFVSQVSLWVMFGILLCFFTLSEMRTSTNKTKKSLLMGAFSVLLTMATSFKLLSLLCLISFSKHLKLRQMIVLASVFLFLNVLIYPSYFIEWTVGFTSRLASAEVYQQSLSQQGLFPLIYKFTQSQTTAFNVALLTLFCSIGFSITAMKAAFREARKNMHTPLNHTVILESGFWMLLAYLASPFPWQYSFSILWMLIPVAWVSGNKIDRRILLACSLLLGLTPKGIIGTEFASVLEGYQFVGFLLVVILVTTGRILKRRSLAHS